MFILFHATSGGELQLTSLSRFAISFATISLAGANDIERRYA